MNILFLTLGHVSKLRGGVDRVTDTLSRYFIRMGHNISMLSVWKPISGDIVEDYQSFLPSQNIPSDDNRSFVKQFLIEKDINVIINQSEPISLLQLLESVHGNIPIVSVIHTDPMGIVKGIDDTWDRWKYDIGGGIRFYCSYPYFLLRKMYQVYTRKKYLRQKYSYYYNTCDAIVLLSEGYKKSFQRMAGIKDVDKLHAIGNPVSFEKSEDNATKEKIILFVGRLEFSPKRLDRLFYVWTQIRDKSGWKICVLGDGVDKAFYTKLSCHLGLDNIEFVGTVNPIPYYNKASILCVTSSHEGFSLVILEALQKGVIPIAFDSYEAVHGLIDSGYNGYIVPAFSIKDYKLTLERLMTDDGLRNSIRNNIRENYNRNEFKVDVIANKWMNLFYKLVK